MGPPRPAMPGPHMLLAFPFAGCPRDRCLQWSNHTARPIWSDSAYQKVRGDKSVKPLPCLILDSLRHSASLGWKHGGRADLHVALYLAPAWSLILMMTWTSPFCSSTTLGRTHGRKNAGRQNMCPSQRQGTTLGIAGLRPGLSVWESWEQNGTQ